MVRRRQSSKDMGNLIGGEFIIGRIQFEIGLVVYGARKLFNSGLLLLAE